ncbi:putative diacylglycerol kinase, zeta, iota [Schistosoma mansoni]|uniref:putative diacylglycerol kinase, zeta, iota n=1 Tax=Schistosoma mansoni TaxID=6183 RepID=UPI00022DC39F|nr:putative diacylglycerol kinase, zeta, iota [Schistosoma mansoni]|eukprot:XP_018653358.1 putative diacylglycerol kinase, zeta, iota [Schistosoma mansoni]
MEIYKSIILELFSRVPNLRILVCGGDGTVGWIFSTIDLMNFNTIPPVAVLPLGTGNDLARALNWGSGYIDESVSKVLNSVYEGRVIALDRWQVNSEVRTDFQTTQQLTDYEDDDSTRNRPISDVLPLKVFNNYFSLGADAATALQFHESREANPEKFNSRLKNKLFYAGCDDKDLTPLIRSLKPHCILFLNIPRYGSGTLPWGQPTTEFQPQRIDDGYIEVIGLTSTSLATLQIGGHGDRICQCRRVHLTTDIVIPMQMDGEPCRLMPSKIDIFCSHQALVIQKLTRSPISAVMSNEDENHLQWKTIGYETRINVFVIALKNYDKMSDDVISLRQTAIWIGIITAKYDTDLSTVRKIITQLNEDTIQDHLYNENSESMETNLKFRVHLSDSWVFIDSTTAASRFFRIDKEQENVHFLTDVCNMEDLFLIDSILESHLTYNNPTTDSFMDDNVLHPLPPPTSLLRDDNDNQLNQFGAKASNLTASDNQNENNDDDDDDDDDDNSIDDGDNDDEDDDDCMNKTQTKNLFISTNNMSVEGEIFIPNDDMIHSTSVLDNESSGDKQANRLIYTIYEINQSNHKNNHNITNTNDCSGSASSSTSSSIQDTSSTLTTNYSTNILPNDNNNIPRDSSLLHKNRQQRDSMFTTNDFIELVNSDSEIIMKHKTESEIEQYKENNDILLINCENDDNLTNESSNNTIEIQVISSDKDPIHEDDDDDDNDINVTTLVQEINNLSLKSKNYHSNQMFEKLLLPNISKQLQYYLNKALLRASHNGLIDHVELLLNAGASIHALDKYGRSCLHLAAKFGHVKVIEHLLKYIPEKLIDLQEYEKNQTALHKAAASRRRVICKILITAGACPTITDIYGKQPSNLALKANDPQLATYLKSKSITTSPTSIAKYKFPVNNRVSVISFLGEEIFFIITNGVEKVDV